MNNGESRNLRRIHNSKVNALTAISAILPPAALSFVERIVFNRCFIPDYLGLYNLFNNIMGMLSAAELGIGIAFAFALYEPLENKKEEQIALLMRLYRKIFFLIGSVIFFLGLVVMAALPYLVKTDIGTSDVRKYFLFFILKTVSYYFFSYKEILFIANQEQYKVTLLNEGARIVTYLVQIAVAVTTKSFLLYCAVTFLISLLKNVTVNIFAGNEFKFLKLKTTAKLERNIYQRMILNAKGVALTKLSSILVIASDSALISIIVGTGVLGLYENYQMMTSGLLMLTVLLPRAVTAAIGSAEITESKETLTRTFLTLNKANFLLYSPLTIVLVSIFNPLIALLFGSERVLPFSSVIIVCLNFYFTSQREIILTYKGALGLYWFDRIRPVLEGGGNLLVSILLGHFMGLNGILLGTLFSQICVNLVIEPRIIFNTGLNTSSKKYYLTALSNFSLTATLSFLSLFISSFIHLPLIASLIAKFLIALLISFSFFLLLFKKDSDVKVMLKTLKKV